MYHSFQKIVLPMQIVFLKHCMFYGLSDISFPTFSKEKLPRINELKHVHRPTSWQL